MKNETGFTLVELMITVAIVAIVTTLAVPAWSDFVSRNRVAAEINEFVTALHYARSEAVRRNSEVSLCPSSDHASCLDGTDWSTGWMAFVGDDPDAPGDIIRVWEGADEGSSLDGDAENVTYRGDGSAEAVASFGLERKGCEGNGRRTIALNMAGRPQAGKAQCAH